MWAFPKIFETLEAACLDATQRLCAAAASAAKRGVQTLPLDNGQVVLLVQSGSAWFAHTGLIAPETQRAVQPLLGAHPLVLGSDHR